MEGLGSYACYQAFVPYAAREALLGKLDETGMRKVYDEIELPLVFTLDSMEKWGISVKGEELKSYGEKLMIRIQELEKLIWEEAGEEFNINSPKQLGVLRSWDFRAERRPRPATLQQQISWISWHRIMPL